MPTVPILEQQVQSRALPAPTLGASLRPVSDPYIANDGMTNLAKAVSGVAAEAKDRGDAVAVLDAQKQMDDWEASKLYDPSTGYLAKRGKDAFDGPKQLLDSYQTDMTTIRDNLGNADQQAAFDKLAASRRDNIMRTTYTHERDQMNTYASETAKASAESAVNRSALNYNNPAVVDAAVDAAKQATITQGRVLGLPQEAIDNNVLEVESKARLGVLSRYADSDPKAAVDYFKANQEKFTGPDLLAANKVIVPTERKYKAATVAQSVLSGTLPKLTKDSIIDYVMQDIEGGDKLVTDNNGALVKYGINAASNPDLYKDGATPTAEQAKARYGEKYWGQINGDSLPANMRLVAFDAAVNGFDPKVLGKSLDDAIKEADGDPDKLLQTRAEYYKKLATGNPEKFAPQLDGWMNRLAKIKAQLGVAAGDIPNEVDLNNKIDASTTDIEVATDAKALVNKQVEAMRKTQKDAWENASQTAWRFQTNGMEVPASIEARMKPEDVAQMRAKAPPDPALYESTRQQILAGQPVDLTSMRWRLGSKFDDLVELQGDPAKVSGGRKVDDVIKASGEILLGKATPKTPADFARIEQFRRAVSTEVQARQKITGKPVTPDDVQSITDNMLLKAKTSSGWFGSEKRMFELEPGEQFSVDGIPGTGTHLIAGEPVTQAAVLQYVTSQMKSRGIPVTDDSVKKYYNRQIQAGQIKYTYDKAK